jgi:uncharacterized protein with PIN domain
MTPFTIRLTFHGDLSFFLKSKTPWIERQLSERTSIKDVIEACGVPHTEVDLILVNGQPVDFAAILTQDVDVDLYPPNETRSPLFPEDRLQVRDIEKFVADGHLGKLVRDLRLLGIDVAYDRDAKDRQLLNVAPADNRAILTRDRRLLMHASVRHGYYLRSQTPIDQTIEVLTRFGLFSAIAPFTRCLRCNAPLEEVKKNEVIQRLEPLTKIYYEEFRRCVGCGQIYWAGSHFSKLQERLEEIGAQFRGAQPN